MPLKIYDDYITRVGTGHWLQQPIYDEVNANTTALFATNLKNWQKMGFTKVLPSPLPSGVTAYLVTRLFVTSTNIDVSMLFGKLVDMGSLDISSNVFTDGSAMPTVTALGSSRVLASPIFVEVTTGLNATPGSLSVTYIDQDGNTAEATTAQAMGASSVAKSAGVAILNSTDWGARDVTTAARTAGTTPTGVVKFWGVIPLGLFIMTPQVDGISFVVDLTNNKCNQFRFGAGDTLGGFVLGTIAKSVLGSIYIVGDN